MTTVLLAGATGMLGSQIAAALLNQAELEVRAIVRADSINNAEKLQKLAPLTDQGLILIKGDLLDPTSLTSVCEGVDVVVSAVSGGEDIALHGQLNLLHAAEAQGVKRMIPSDYSVDYRKLDWGDNYNLDMRKKVFQALEQSSLKYTLILNGVLTEVLFSPWLKIFDFEAGTFNYWGDGETLFDTTAIADVAHTVAQAVLDPSLANQALEIAGDTLSMKQLYATYERVTGQPLQVKHLGSVDQLQQWIDQTKAQAQSPYAYLPQQYLYAMVSGKGKLDHTQNQGDLQQMMLIAQFIQTMQSQSATV